jgi:hypothetical protein
MSIGERKTPIPTPFGGAEWFWSGETLIDFRSSERSRRGFYFAIYKHATPNRGETR